MKEKRAHYLNNIIANLAESGKYFTLNLNHITEREKKFKKKCTQEGIANCHIKMLSEQIL